jgi:alpha/beta superfamily hydrolase
MDLKGNLFIEGPAGRIEAILKEPAAQVTRAAIIAHPHPLFGGTMHNKVVYRIAKAFFERGFATLRFNFRGAGQSQGVHDQGRGEREDLRAAIEFIKQKHADADLWIAGFSFGAWVMLRSGCEDRGIRALVAAGAPVSKYDLAGQVVCDKPKLFVQGAMDEFGSVADLEKLAAELNGQNTIAMIEGADHFFEGRLDEMARAVGEFIDSVITSDG